MAMRRREALAAIVLSVLPRPKSLTKQPTEPDVQQYFDTNRIWKAMDPIGYEFAEIQEEIDAIEEKMTHLRAEIDAILSTMPCLRELTPKEREQVIIMTITDYWQANPNKVRTFAGPDGERFRIDSNLAIFV